MSKNLNIQSLITKQISEFGLNPIVENLILVCLAFSLVAILAFAANFIFKKIILRFISSLIGKTNFNWDDEFLKENVFLYLASVAPATVFYLGSDFIFPSGVSLLGISYSKLSFFIKSVSLSCIIYFLCISATSSLDAGLSIYEKSGASRERPIKAFIEVLKIFIYFITGILIISALFDRSPWALLSGLGALTAVLLLVFKDSILGFVSSVQLAANKMVKAGDWIEVDKYGADGEVMDVSLTTVKIRNWDKTVTTVPTYSLISDSFKNWRGMTESGGRRIKRAIFLEPSSVKFCSKELLEKLSKVNLIKDHIKSKKTELDRYHKDLSLENSDLINQRRLTNLGLFRAYIESYLKNNSNIHQRNMSLLVRQLQMSSQNGIGIEIYAFSKITSWKEYEEVQADIFDHLVAILGEFELGLFSYSSQGDLVREN